MNCCRAGDGTFTNGAPYQLSSAQLLGFPRSSGGADQRSRARSKVTTTGNHGQANGSADRLVQVAPGQGPLIRECCYEARHQASDHHPGPGRRRAASSAPLRFAAVNDQKISHPESEQYGDGVAIAAAERRQGKSVAVTLNLVSAPGPQGPAPDAKTRASATRPQAMATEPSHCGRPSEAPGPRPAKALKRSPQPV